ncbi:helix-hairpin-helix domain-containing protein [Oceanobacillus bengalensis]|uniref:ComEA family DNA-binding protein n=1 Tax=Oceanobacillus bengalensis TaxID=1435466 RepID=A0A494Z5P3_9BACI|nr:helix-hairpin-helix domain-containing protein [Oceanobacillus bengalensis]RKQ17872.1 ComEA family DNA-binding protein [Oceanobacillus bengalensis]
MLNLLKKGSFVILTCIVFLLFLFFTREDFNEPDGDLTAVTSSNNLLPEESSIETETQDSAVVDVKGGVVNPGVYEMNIDARVNDVIKKAGGFTADADQTTVNLAQKVHDEMIIFIPVIGDVSNIQTGPTNDSSKIRINSASKEEIEGLSGIGPSKAEAIIQHREEQGYFQTVEDLLEVSGIGEKTLENIKEEIQVP